MTQCFTCDNSLNEFQVKFILYQCFLCKDKTPYCLKCAKIVSKLLSAQVFKCGLCNSITKIMTKEEVIFTDEREREVTISPQSGFLLIDTPNKPGLNGSYLFKTPRNSSFREEDCINDFNQLNLTVSNKEEVLAQRYRLLGSRKNLTPRKSDLLNLSHSEGYASKNDVYYPLESEFAGYNKNKRSKKITPISLNQMPNQGVIPSVIAEQSKLASIAIQRINFSKGYDESDKPAYGVKCQLSDSQPQFNVKGRQIPNITTSSFKLN